MAALSGCGGPDEVDDDEVEVEVAPPDAEDVDPCERMEFWRLKEGDIT